MSNFKIVTILLICVISFGGFYFIKQLFHQLFYYQVQLEVAEINILAKNQQIDALYQKMKTHQSAYLELTAQIEASNALLLKRTEQIERLKRENSILRKWADTHLPDDIVCLHEHPPKLSGVNILDSCPKVSACELPAQSLHNNQSLSHALLITESA